MSFCLNSLSPFSSRGAAPPPSASASNASNSSIGRFYTDRERLSGARAGVDVGGIIGAERVELHARLVFVVGDDGDLLTAITGHAHQQLRRCRALLGAPFEARLSEQRQILRVADV